MFYEILKICSQYLHGEADCAAFFASPCRTALRWRMPLKWPSSWSWDVAATPHKLHQNLKDKKVKRRFKTPKTMTLIQSI